jgi:myo-inositol-1(or 4)-monophosphatase
MDNAVNRVELAEKAAVAAGQEILKYDIANLKYSTKSSPGDFVTEADLASERIIREVILDSYPEDTIISEETSLGQELLVDSKLPLLTAWILDPIDGTNNFKRGMGYSGISVAYVVNGAVEIGVVYDPYKKDLYVAQKGQGAKKNNLPIHVSDKGVFDNGTRVCTSNTQEGGTQQNLDRYRKLGDVWVDVLSSAVLIMTDVASGRLDLYHHVGLKPWDNAAAFLIASEAGAKITDLTGRPVSWLTKEVVMGNNKLVDEFIAKICQP